MRGFRTSVDQIRVVDSCLADKFAGVSRDLEVVMLTISSTNGDGDSEDDDLEGMDRIGLLLLQQRKLLDDREELISQVRALPGFECFLKAPSFDSLALAALGGPNSGIGSCTVEIPESTISIQNNTSIFYALCSLACMTFVGPSYRKAPETKYLHILSYTPTLCALIEARKDCKETFKRPSILLVAQPDQSLLAALPEIWSIQRLSTKLHDGQRLTLLELIRSQLPVAEFAFLSACHTVEMTEGSIADEALHLTAAMQYCGFRSVVGTMWGMADDDGPELVEQFYKSMFSSDEPGTPYHERSASALRNAVRRLRKKGVPLERWVNFVHYVRVSRQLQFVLGRH
ncbi:hypothetical protein F5148DRAFT_1148231 [Russula earlei]|uniref:Uncharacterized protein n=1 Tax=Russula earlei TaxID=71964 RepID=A0ACC0UD52_9AGAM|nr:hypothetical protein F5148DRAFT_1148231 [Russula earlei]